MKRIVILLACTSLFACGDATVEIAEEPPTLALYDGAQHFKDDAAKLAHGERLSKVLGCAGCHNANFQGGNMTEGDPAFGKIYAANISLKLQDYDDAALKKLLRVGIPLDGHQMIFMPSEMYQHVRDADMDALIMFLRTIKPAGQPQPSHEVGPALEGMMASGEYDFVDKMVARWKNKGPADLGEQHAKGRYIALTACTECHEIDLTGFPEFSPDLELAATYNGDEFATMMRTGKGKSKPDLGLMSLTAQHRYAYFTAAEVKALHGYLVARAEAKKPE